jgi:hypothetical protein
MDQDNGERPSSSSSPPKPIIVRPIKDPTDLIGWLFLKDKGNGERHRNDPIQDNGERSASSTSPKSASLHRSLDPSDLIGWLFLKDQDDGEHRFQMLRYLGYHCPITDPAYLTDWSFQNDQDNGERASLSPTTKPVIVRPIQENGERPSSSPTIKPVVVRSTIDTTDLVGWLFLKDQDNGERHRVQMLPHGCGRPIIDPADLISSLSLGSLQSAVSLGRMDIATVVMAMSSFRAVPRRGHYHDWMSTVYGECKDDVPTGAPLAMGRSVSMVHYVDDNRMQDVSVTGCTHLLNQTSKSATHGTTFVAAMNRTEQTLAIGTLPRYPAVPVGDESYLTGNNQVVKISAVPEAKSLHRVQETTTASMAQDSQLWDDWQPLYSWSAMNTVVDRYEDKDDIMDLAEVAKKNKIQRSAADTVHQSVTAAEIRTNEVEQETSGVDTGVKEGFKRIDGVVSAKNLGYAKKKMTVHFVSKGRGVTENKKDRARVKDISDSLEAGPFLAKTDAACQTCGNTKGAPASRSAEDGSIGIPDVA